MTIDTSRFAKTTSTFTPRSSLGCLLSAASEVDVVAKILCGQIDPHGTHGNRVRCADHPVSLNHREFTAGRGRASNTTGTADRPAPKCVAISRGEVAEPNVVRSSGPYSATRLPDVRRHCGHLHGSKRDTETHPEMLVMCVASVYIRPFGKSK